MGDGEDAMNMFFTKAGRAIAWLCVLGSILHYGYLQVFSFTRCGILPGHPMWDSLSSATKTDMPLFACGVVIGLLAEISTNLANLTQAEKGHRGDVGAGPKV